MDGFDVRGGRFRRRDLLKSGAVAGAGLAASSLIAGTPLALARGKSKKYKTQRVVLIGMAGGVRAREVIHSPANCPNILSIAEKGVVFPEVRAANLGHYGAALAIFTGCRENRGIRENGRGGQPTIFEYLRKDLQVPAHEVWLSTTAGAQTVNFSHGMHKDYGAEYGANLISTDGLFNAEFKDLIGKFGNASLPSDKEAATVTKLLKSLDPKWIEGAKGHSSVNDPDASLRIQRYILEELKGDTARITGPGSGDAKSIRVARNLMRLFKPRLISVVLQNADVAHGSFNSYQEVIRRNDKEIGLLWQSIQADPELRDSTSIFILPEFGRDKNLNQRNGLDHGDGSSDLNRIFLVAAGPDFKQGKVVKKGIDSYDVCPTAAALLGADAAHARGKVIKHLFA